MCSPVRPEITHVMRFGTCFKGRSCFERSHPRLPVRHWYTLRANSLPSIPLPCQSASAVEKIPLTTTKLGGQLEPFADVNKGYRCAKPLGWNRYDGTAGEYVVKLVDLVDPTQVILLTNSPVKSDTEVRCTHIAFLVVLAQSCRGRASSGNAAAR